MAKKIDLKGKTIYDLYDDEAGVARLLKMHNMYCDKEYMRTLSESVRMMYIWNFACWVSNDTLRDAAHKAYKAAMAEEDRIAMEGIKKGIIIDF